MRYNNIYALYFFSTAMGITAEGTGTGSSITDFARDDSSNTGSHSYYQRVVDPGDVHCDIYDNSPSTGAVRMLARQLIGEFPIDDHTVARQNNMIKKCSYVLESDISYRGPEGARIEICAGFKQTESRVKIGRDMLRLANKCSENRKGVDRTQGWVGYYNWGRFQAVPM